MFGYSTFAWPWFWLPHFIGSILCVVMPQGLGLGFRDVGFRVYIGVYIKVYIGVYIGVILGLYCSDQALLCSRLLEF